MVHCYTAQMKSIFKMVPSINYCIDFLFIFQTKYDKDFAFIAVLMVIIYSQLKQRRYAYHPVNKRKWKDLSRQAIAIRTRLVTALDQ